MTTSTFPATGGFVDNTSAAKFIPEIWSDEIIAAYKTNLVLAPLVKKMSMKGKKGDTIHIPAPTRGVASAKVENTAVTVQNAVESEVIVTINKHFEYSRIIEDITETQALSSLRQFYTGDAGYALAKQVDDDLFALGQYFGNGSGTLVHNNSFFCDATTGLTAYAEDTVAPADVFTDACFRALIQQMDDLDVPMDNRSFVMPPSLRNAITGIDRYVSSDFVDGRAVTNGKLGNLYGIDLFVTSNCPIVETAAANSANTGNVRGALLIHKDACVLAEQVGIRSQTQYKQEFLGTLYTADTLYGTKVVRPESGLVLVVNN